jgi:hypothetical protein
VITIGSLTPLLQTLIGASAAIFGGIIGAVVTYRLTLRLLRRERQDEALLELITFTPYLRGTVVAALEQHRRDPRAVVETRGLATLKLQGWPEFRSRWLQYLAPRIDDGKVHAAYHRAGHELAAADDFMSEESKNEPVNPAGEPYWIHLDAAASALEEMHERSLVLLAKRSRWPIRGSRRASRSGEHPT